MMPRRTIYTAPAAIAALAAIALAAANWLYEPEKGLVWVMLIIALFVAAAVPSILFRSQTEKSEFSRKTIERSLFSAFLLLAGVLGFAFLNEIGVLSAGASKRAAGAVIGFVLIATGNALPKIITPTAMRSCDPAKAKATERFAGWVFVLGGIGYVFTWFFAPIESAKLWSSGIALSAFLIVVVAWARLATLPNSERFQARAVTSDQSHQKKKEISMAVSSNRRFAAILLLHALAWAFAMLFASAIFENASWGNQVAPWMSVGFVLANGLLIAARRSNKQDQEEGRPS